MNRVAPGKSGYLRFRTEVDTGAPWDALTINYVSATNFADDFSFTASATGNRVRHLTLNSYASPTDVFCSEKVTYTITYQNICTERVLNLVIKNPLPAGAENLEPLDGGIVIGGPMVEWTIGEVLPGEGGSVSFLVTMNGSKDVVYNIALADYQNSSGEPMPQLTAASGLVDVRCQLYFRKFVRPQPCLERGDPVTYTLDIVNKTETTAWNIRLWDTLPPEVSNPVCQPPCGIDGNVVSWLSVPHVPPGATTYVEVTVDTPSTCDTIGLNVGVMNFTWDPSVAGSTTLMVDAETEFAEPWLGQINPTTGEKRPWFLVRAVTNPVPEQGRFTYTYQLVNQGCAQALNVTIWDTLPADVDFVSCAASVPPCTYDPATRIVVWDVPPVPADSIKGGLSVTVDITSIGKEIKGNCAMGSYTNAFSCTTFYTNDDCIDVRLAQPEIKVEAAQYASAEAVSTGGELTYLFSFTNTGTDTALNLTVWDTLPAGLSYLSCAVSLGGTCWYDSASNQLEWFIPRVDTGENVYVSFTGTVYSTGPPVCNVATLDYENRVGVKRGPVSPNEVCVRVDEPSLQLVKEAAHDPVGQDSTETYRLTLTNTGGVAAVNITVWDSLPPGALFVSCSGGSTCWFDGVMTLWRVPPLSASQFTEVYATVIATADFSCSNYAEADYTNLVPVAKPRVRSNPSCVQVVQAVMEVKMTTDQMSYLPGDLITYAILYSNTGTGDAFKVGLWVPFPPGVEYDSHTGTGNLRNSNTQVYWDLGSISPGESGEVTLIMKALSPQCTVTTVSNIALMDYMNIGGVPQPRASVTRDITIVDPSLPVWPLEISVVKEQVTIGGVGEPVLYRIVVTNTGSSTVENLVVTDMVSPIVTGTATDQDPAFIVVGPTDVPGGTRYEWTATGLNMTPGESFTFTVTGTVGVVCVQTLVSNVASIEARDVCTTTTMITNQTSFTVEPQSISVVTEQLQIGKEGEPVLYRIVVTNTGSAIVENLVVTDTVPSIVMSVTTQEPAVMGTPSVSQLSSGTHYTWSGSSLNMTPGMSFTFTITGTLGLVCMSTVVPNEAYIEASTICSATGSVTNQVSFIVQPLGVAVVAEQVTTGGVGDPVTYQIVVTNTGGATVENLMVTDTVSPVVRVLVRDQPAGFTSLGPAQVSSGTWYGWSNSAPLSFKPGQSYTFTITGTVGAVCVTTVVPNEAYIEVSTVCGATLLTTNQTSFTVPPLLVAQGASPAFVTVGQWFAVTLTATNTGGEVADVQPSIAVGPGAALVSLQSGPLPPGPVTLTPGNATTFVWMYSASGSGLVSFTVTATGPPCGGAPLLAAATVSTTVQTPAALSAELVVTPSTVCVGQNLLVTVVVMNIGEARATGMKAEPFLLTGSGSASYVDGPTPGMPVSLAGREVKIFTWTYTGASVGMVTFTTTVGGNDGNSGVPLPPMPLWSSAVTVQEPAILRASASSPATAVEDQTVEVTLTVTNTGGQPATGIVPAAAIGPGAGLVMAETGPLPSGPVTLAPGTAQTFTWTYTLLDSGSITFTLTAQGITCGTSVVRGSASTSLTVREPPLILRVFPNPYEPSEAVRGTLKFTGLHDEAVVSIFTLTGVEIRRLARPVKHRLEWDGYNEQGSPAAPGIYLYAVEWPDGRGGKKHLKGKFGLIR